MATAAGASPVTYDFTGGYVTLSADIGGTDFLPAGEEIPLTGTQATFDAGAMSLTSFQFSDAGPSAVELTGPYAGIYITLSNLVVAPGSGYATLSASGSNPYNFTVGPVTATGLYALSGLVTRSATAFSGSNPFLSGEITLGSADTLDLTGITIGAFSADGQTVTLKGDIVFTGAAAVPVPPSAWLFASGLGILGFVKRRRAAWHA